MIEEYTKITDTCLNISMKKAFGLEYLDFYFTKKGLFACRYIKDPNDFDYDKSMSNFDMEFLFKALSMQQGKVYFEDYGIFCRGLDGLNELYLPMKLSGL